MDMAKYVPKFKAKASDEDKYINILLLGESGAGKSTFINSFVNYLQFSSLEDAQESSNVTCLIPTKFSVTSEDGETVVVNFGDDANEDKDLGNSSTQAAKAYVFPFEKKMIRLIDTPGINDSRGAITKDRENFENILEYIGQFQHLHSICFLLKPDVTVLTAGFKYCLIELLSRLDRSAATNISFLFTRTRSTDYKAPDTINCIRRVLKDIADSENVDIPLRYRNSEQKNCFYFDNEGFKYLVALRKGLQSSNTSSSEKSWDVSYESSWALIRYIVGDEKNAPLPPHVVQNTVSVNEARRLIFELAKPLADITEFVQDNLEALRRHQEDLLNENLSKDELRAKLYVPVVDLVQTDLSQPVTICAAAKCAKVYTIAGMKKYHYEQRCHNPCYLHNVQKDIVGDPGLLHCAAMGGTQKCQQCTCDFSMHMHVYYETKTIESKIEDLTVQAQLATNKEIIETQFNFIQKLEKRVKDYQEEHKIISSGLATFAYFLKHNSICPINDAYEAYLDCLIQREKIAFGSNKDLLQRYESLKLEHIEQKRLLEEAGRIAQMQKITHVTSEQIIFTVERLKKLPLTGKKIAELHNCLVGRKRTEMLKNMEYVHPEIAMMPKKRDVNNVGGGAKRKDNQGKATQADIQKQLLELIDGGNLEDAARLLQSCIDEQTKQKEEDAAKKLQLDMLMQMMKDYTNNQTEQQKANANAARVNQRGGQRGSRGRGNFQNRGSHQQQGNPQANRGNFNQGRGGFNPRRGGPMPNRGNQHNNNGYVQKDNNFGNWRSQQASASFMQTPYQQPSGPFVPYNHQPAPVQYYQQQRPQEPIQLNINLGPNNHPSNYNQPLSSPFEKYAEPPPAYSPAMHAANRAQTQNTSRNAHRGGAGGQFKKHVVRKQQQVNNLPPAADEEDDDVEEEDEEEETENTGILEMKKYLAEKRRNFKEERDAEDVRKQAEREERERAANAASGEKDKIEKMMSSLMKMFKKN